MSNISQKDLGKVILEDISAQTVSRCEMRCGASLIASSRNYFDLMKTRVLDERNIGFSLCFMLTDKMPRMGVARCVL